MPAQPLINDVPGFIDWAMKSNAYPRFARKLFKTGNVAGLGGAINIAYGSVTYDQVNRESNGVAVMKKVPWGTSGHRVFTGNPAVKGYGDADPGAIGAVIDTSPSELSTIPAFLHSPFDLTMDAAFRAQHDDGLDVWQWKVAVMRDIHAQLINEEWLRSAEGEAADLTANTSDAKNDANGKGHESLDRLIASSAEEDDLGHATYTGGYDVLEGEVDRDTATTYDSYVVRPDGELGSFGSNVPFQMKGLNQALDRTEDNGADPRSQILLTGRDTRRAIYDELSGHGRVDLTDVQAKLDLAGLSPTSTHAGRDISFAVRAYQQRIIVTDKHVASNGTSDWGTNSANGGTGKQHIYGIDQRHVFLKLGFPTLFVDVDNPVIRRKFDTEALYLTCQQGMATRFNTSFKVRSIS